MTNDAIKATRRVRKPKRRKFYDMGPNFRLGGPPGYEIENENTLSKGLGLLCAPPGRRGFPDYPEPPRVVLDKKLGRSPRDLEQCHEYWLISDRMKAVLQAVDPEAFAFVRCEVRFADGKEGPAYWLCDVMRILDAVDEVASRLTINIDQTRGQKVYSLRGGASLVFKEDVVAPAHIFRMAHLEPVIFCDQHLKNACKAAGLKGITFKDAANL